MPDSAWLILAALGAGILNTIAGGGTFLTFPALVFIGVPPVMANATSAVAVFPGYLGGALGFRKELQVFDRPTLLRLVVITLAGGLAGSLLVGVNFAKALAWVHDLPLIGVNHLEGHIYAAWLVDPGEADRPEPEFPLVALVVSGGHTFLVEMRDQRAREAEVGDPDASVTTDEHVVGLEVAVQ